MNRFRDWIEQAGVNLAHAEHSASASDYAWACFAAHQAAEAAVKGLHLRCGQVAWGHALLDLMTTLPEDVRPDEHMVEIAGVLDKYYIPTRYPDAHPAGPAARHYTAAEAAQAIALSREVVTYCERKSLET